MARCNCAAGGGCSCSVQEGDYIRVTGSGEASNPYVIEALRQPIDGQLAVTDTATLNLTLTGEGLVGEPYTISGEVLGAPGGPTALSDLSDVDTTGAMAGDSLIYDGTQWVGALARYPTVSATEPPDPFVGQIWFDIS